ncbi:MAG: hypothetical protein NT062_27730 [Proteobacteria bacterium]|nr:hypothetical protein [Pseudomonadota bacterium]
MPLDPAFVADCPYEPTAVLIDDIVSCDPATSTIVARLPTHDDLPLTRDQRAHPVRHPRHVAGGLMVHLTGILGFAHAYYLLELRHHDGWIGYGTHIHAGRFRRMGKIGPPMLLSCQALSVRRIRGVIVPRYRFVFTQDGEAIYEAEHSAIFTQVDQSATPSRT